MAFWRAPKSGRPLLNTTSSQSSQPLATGSFATSAARIVRFFVQSCPQFVPAQSVEGPTTRSTVSNASECLAATEAWTFLAGQASPSMLAGPNKGAIFRNASAKKLRPPMAFMSNKVFNLQRSKNISSAQPYAEWNLTNQRRCIDCLTRCLSRLASKNHPFAPVGVDGHRLQGEALAWPSNARP